MADYIYIPYGNEIRFRSADGSTYKSVSYDDGIASGSSLLGTGNTWTAAQRFNTYVTFNETRPQTDVILNVHEDGSDIVLGTPVWRGRAVAGGDVAAVALGQRRSQAWIQGHAAGLGSIEELHIQPDGTKNLIIGAGASSTWTGRLGVGVAAPFVKMDVAGSMRLTGSASSVLTGSIDPAASTAVVGVGTLFLTELMVGDRITVSGETRTVTAIADDTNLTVDSAFSNNANDTSPDRLPPIFLLRDSANAIVLKVDSAGAVTLSGALTANDLTLAKTITAGGTTGAQTINKAAGRVNFAAAATSLVVTNSLVTANSIIILTMATNDGTARLGAAVASNGSFTIWMDVAPASECAVNFLVIN